MKNNNSEVKYNLLVLLDLSQDSETILTSAVNLAKAINGSIEILYIKPAMEVVKSENQLSALSAIDKESFTIEKQLKSLVQLASEGNSIPIIYDFRYGNVKNEIAYHLEKSNPDIVVLGKRNQKSFNFLGNDVTQFLLNQYSGNIFIAGENEMLQTNLEMSIGFYNDIIDDQSVDITKQLGKQTANPVKFFRVRKNLEMDNEDVNLKRPKFKSNFEKTIEYVFEPGANAIDGLVNYVSKNNIDLLCMGRGNNQNNEKNWFSDVKPELRQVIQKLKIPLLIMQDRASL